MSNLRAIVVGAGIVGLATARALALKGYSVRVVERSHRAVGASIRNFGMVWPIGQPEGDGYERAMRSRSVWKEIGTATGIWYEEAGSLHLAYQPDEWTVMEEFREKRKGIFSLMTPDEIEKKFQGIQSAGLIGGLYSPAELIVDPRQAIASIPTYLEQLYDVCFTWGECATAIEGTSVYLGKHKKLEADTVWICSGADFETLFPEVFTSQPITKCKLQMLRMAAQPNDWRIGTSVCGGLSLTHYKSFEIADSLSALKMRLGTELPEYLKWGIHVMVAQNGLGELTIGDSHEYGPTHDPFDNTLINQYILDYLARMIRFPKEQVIETWNGIYPKLTNGRSEFYHSPAPGIHILNALGGAGMTLSFGRVYSEI